MPFHHMQHVQNMGPNLFVCNENNAYVISHVPAHAVTYSAHMQASQLPLCKHGMPEITCAHAIHVS